jgi:hypothetical protein
MDAKDNWLKGAVSGFVATCWMSTLMILARKLGPTAKLPPRRIVEAAVATTLRKPVKPSTVQKFIWRFLLALVNPGFGLQAIQCVGWVRAHQCSC